MSKSNCFHVSQYLAFCWKQMPPPLFHLSLLWMCALTAPHLFFFNGLCFIAVLHHLSGQTVRDPANGSPFKLVPILWRSHLFLFIYILRTRYFKLTLYLPCLILKSVLSLKSPDMLIASGVSVLLGPLYTHSYDIHPHICKYTCIYVHIHTQVSKIMNPIAPVPIYPCRGSFLLSLIPCLHIPSSSVRTLVSPTAAHLLISLTL